MSAGWRVFELTHEPEKPQMTREEMQNELEALEMELERKERVLKHAGTKIARLGAERRIDELESAILAIRRKLGSRSVVGSCYGSTPGIPEGRVLPHGAAARCSCGNPMTKKEAYEGAGWCPECLWRAKHGNDNNDQEDRSR